MAVDMDGTLLDPHGTITQNNADAIHRLKDYGVEFLICTGRDYQNAKKIISALHIECGYICLSGATVYAADGTLLSENPLTEDGIHTIRQLFDQHKISMDILSANGRFCTSDPEEKFKSICHFYSGGKPLADPIPEEIMARAREWADGIQFIPDISRALLNRNAIYKILGNDLPEETVRLLKEEFAHFPSLAAASSFPTNIELTSAQAQKGVALKYYAQFKNIPLNAVMTIGDSDNDLSMFTPEFGWTVAMDNAMDCIKEAAKYHTRSNRSDGVAYAIEQYIIANAR